MYWRRFSKIVTCLLQWRHKYDWRAEGIDCGITRYIGLAGRYTYYKRKPVKATPRHLTQATNVNALWLARIPWDWQMSVTSSFKSECVTDWHYVILLVGCLKLRFTVHWTKRLGIICAAADISVSFHGLSGAQTRKTFCNSVLRRLSCEFNLHPSLRSGRKLSSLLLQFGPNLGTLRLIAQYVVKSRRTDINILVPLPPPPPTPHPSILDNTPFPLISPP
jgi:hypothetical protein